jgi:hypothetical protein
MMDSPSTASTIAGKRVIISNFIEKARNRGNHNPCGTYLLDKCRDSGEDDLALVCLDIIEGACRAILNAREGAIGDTAIGINHRKANHIAEQHLARRDRDGIPVDIEGHAFEGDGGIHILYSLKGGDEMLTTEAALNLYLAVDAVLFHIYLTEGEEYLGRVAPRLDFDLAAHAVGVDDSATFNIG